MNLTIAQLNRLIFTLDLKVRWAQPLRASYATLSGSRTRTHATAHGSLLLRLYLLNGVDYVGHPWLLVWLGRQTHIIDVLILDGVVEQLGHTRLVKHLGLLLLEVQLGVLSPLLLVHHWAKTIVKQLIFVKLLAKKL